MHRELIGNLPPQGTLRFYQSQNRRGCIMEVCLLSNIPRRVYRPFVDLLLVVQLALCCHPNSYCLIIWCHSLGNGERVVVQLIKAHFDVEVTDQIGNTAGNSGTGSDQIHVNVLSSQLTNSQRAA